MQASSNAFFSAYSASEKTGTGKGISRLNLETAKSVL